MMKLTLIKREILEVSIDLICISEAQEHLFDEIIKKSDDLTKAGQDPSKLHANLQNTVTTLKALAVTIADTQSSFKYSANIFLNLSHTRITSKKSVTSILQNQT